MPSLALSPKASRHVAPILSRFGPPSDKRWEGTFACRVAREQAPVPWLVYLVLVQIGGLKDIGRHEKTLWQVPFRFDGIDAVIRHEKFGLRLYIDRGGLHGRDSSTVAEDILSKLRALITAAERDILKDLAARRLDDGRVTLVNQNHPLRGAYEHFRREAQESLAASRDPDTTEIGEPGTDGWLTIGLSRRFERTEIGSYNGLAAINAYFSWLEHVLVLMFAFASEPPTKSRLASHIGNRWADKFKSIFDMHEPDTGRVYADLHDIAETYRNTYGHGGFDKRGAAIAVHVEGIGAVPAALSDIRSSPHFEAYPFATESFTDVTTKLDRVDAFLQHGPMSLAKRYIDSGLDAAFDPSSRSALLRAARSVENMERLIERRSKMVDDYLNMDW